METCKICGIQIPSKGCRLLTAGTSVRVLKCLEEFEESLPPSDRGSCTESVYPCKSCFSNTEKYIRHIQLAAQLKNKLCTNWICQRQAAASDQVVGNDSGTGASQTPTRLGTRQVHIITKLHGMHFHANFHPMYRKNPVACTVL